MRYLPLLRGVTVYPDGARGGQPITKVDIEEAYGFEGYEYQEYGNESSCKSGVCGI
jgi:ribonucleoside-diphosphate reductase alpha chain